MDRAARKYPGQHRPAAEAGEALRAVRRAAAPNWRRARRRILPVAPRLVSLEDQQNARADQQHWPDRVNPDVTIAELFGLQSKSEQ